MIVNNIKKLMKTLNLNQKAFAKPLGISQSSLSQVLSKKIGTSALLITGICKTYNVNRDWLLTGKGEMFIKEDFPEIVREKPVWEIIPDNCPADPVCQQICIHCMVLPPDDKVTALLLFEILISGKESTKNAIRQNIHEFHKLVIPSDYETDFKTSKRKRVGRSKRS
jgi:transcriptional regulator with XRE-family HTH domain